MNQWVAYSVSDLAEPARNVSELAQGMESRVVVTVICSTPGEALICPPEDLKAPDGMHITS